MVTKFAASYLKKPIVTVCSQIYYYKLPCFHTFFQILFLSTIFHITSAVSTSTTTPISYTHHCSSIIPQSTPISLDFTNSPFPAFQIAYYAGGDTIINQNSPKNSSYLLKTLWLRTRKVYETDVEGVFKVEASVTLRNSNLYNFAQNYTVGQMNAHRSRIGSLSFGLQGFWSQSCGKICMVGSASSYSKQGNLLHLGAVFKLNYVSNSSLITSLVTGTLESSSSANDSSYFEPISIFVFTPMNYKYSLISQEFDSGCFGGSDVPLSLPLSSQPQKSLCLILSKPLNGLELKYASDCGSAKNCSPFGGNIGDSPRFMSLNVIQCSEDNQMLRVLVQFSDNNHVGYEHPFSLNATLVGEGLWDGKTNQLCVVACRILNAMDSLGDAHVGDCSIRLSLRFPAIWSIRESSSIVGQIWSNKIVNDSGYFKRIMYRSYEDPMAGVQGLKYEYTEIERVRKLCPGKKSVKNKGARYPNGHSYDMRFDMSVANSKGGHGWGYSIPLSVGDLFYKQQLYPMELSSFPPTNSAVQAKSGNSTPVNISYKISYTIQHRTGISPFNTSSPNVREEISAEGIYDAKTGSLCMVGCREIRSNNGRLINDSMDCEILVKFQFPSSDSEKNGGYIKGSIESARKQSNTLYFEHLDLSSLAIIQDIAKQSIWRMDFEITMVLISNTFACVFVVFQLFYVKKNPDMLPFTSLVMLGILTLRYMIPLVLNFEALFLQNHSFSGSDGWIQLDEVTIRVVTMLAFLLQFRLLHLTWSARSGDKNQKDLWAAEKKVLYVSLPLYAAGGLIACFVSWRKYNKQMLLSKHSHETLWGALKSYGGLVIDGFLLPQILLNILRNLREKPLSRAFYVGTTFVRLVPHAYDLYRAHIYASYFSGMTFYANPGADFYSPAWDIIIPCGGLLFAAVIYLQQRFGGCCILPQRFRLLEEYEKVPAVSNT